MEFNIRNRMDAQIYLHTGHNSKELVFGIGNEQRDNKMGIFDSEVQSHVFI
jgi:hypothetical protein